MYSDIWLNDSSVHKAPPIAITDEINLVRWLNESNELIGISLSISMKRSTTKEMRRHWRRTECKNGFWKNGSVPLRTR